MEIICQMYFSSFVLFYFMKLELGYMLILDLIKKERFYLLSIYSCFQGYKYSHLLRSNHMSATWFIFIHKPGSQQRWLPFDSYNMCILTCSSTSWYRTCNIVVTGACQILWDNKCLGFISLSVCEKTKILQILTLWSFYCAVSAYRLQWFSWILCNKNPLINAVWIRELVTREP